MASDPPKTSIITGSYDVSTSLTVPPEQIEQEVDATRASIEDAYSPNTRRAYATSWRAFEAWCRERSLSPDAATPDSVAVFLQWRADNGLSVKGVTREYNGLASKLREIGPEARRVWAAKARPDIISRLLRGLARGRGRSSSRKAAITPAHFAALADPSRFDASRWVQSARDRALLLTGFGGGFRRSALVGLDVEDLAFSDEGVSILIRRDKTDPLRQGRTIGIYRQASDRCPVAALETYLRGANIGEGAVFRSMRRGELTERRLCDRAVALIIKAAVESIGLDPKVYAGHSLRVGFVTTARRQGWDLEAIMNQTGHKSFEQVRDYIRRDNPFENNATKGILEDE